MAAPLGGGVGGSGTLTITTRKVDSGPLGGGAGGPAAPTINAKNINGSPLGSGAGGLGAHTTQLKDVDGRPLGPLVRSPSMIRKFAVTCMGSIDKCNTIHGSYSPCA
jgi:hypothetical protein